MDGDTVKVSMCAESVREGGADGQDSCSGRVRAGVFDRRGVCAVDDHVSETGHGDVEALSSGGGDGDGAYDGAGGG